MIANGPIYGDVLSWKLKAIVSFSTSSSVNIQYNINFFVSPFSKLKYVFPIWLASASEPTVPAFLIGGCVPSSFKLSIYQTVWKILSYTPDVSLSSTSLVISNSTAA